MRTYTKEKLPGMWLVTLEVFEHYPGGQSKRAFELEHGKGSELTDSCPTSGTCTDAWSRQHTLVLRGDNLKEVQAKAKQISAVPGVKGLRIPIIRIEQAFEWGGIDEGNNY